MRSEFVLYRSKNTIVNFGLHIGVLFGVTVDTKHDIDIYITVLCFAIHVELLGKGKKV